MDVSRFQDKYNTQGTGAVTSGTEVPQPKKPTDPKSTVVPIGKTTEPAEIIKILSKDTEFLALSRAEKKKKLEEHFPQATSEIIDGMLNNIEAKIATQDTQASNQNRLLDKTVIFDNINKLLEQYNIVIPMSDFNKLTNVLDALINGKDIKISDLTSALQPFAKILDKITPAEQADPKAWGKLSAREKLDKRMDAFLGILISDYEKLDDEKKEYIRNKAFDKAVEIIFPTSKMSDTTKNIAKGAFAKIFEIAEEKQITIESLMKNPQDSMEQVAEGVLENWQNSDINSKFKTDEWKNADAKTQLKMVISSLVKQLDPSITDEDIAKMTTEEIVSVLDPIGKNLIKEEWDRDPKSSLNALVTKLAAFNYYNSINEDNPISAKDFLSNPIKQLDVLEAYEKDITEPKLTHFQQTQREVFREMAKNVSPDELAKLKQPSLTDMKNFLQEKLKDKNLTPEQRERYTKTLEGLNANEKILKETFANDPKGLEEALNKPYTPVENTGAYEITTKYKTENGYDYEGYIQAQCNIYGVKDKSKLNAAQQYEILNNIRDPELAIEIGKSFGLTRKQVGALLNTQNAIQDFTQKDSETQFQLADIFADDDNPIGRRFGYITAITKGQELDKSIDKIGAKTEAFLIGEHKNENAIMIGQVNNQLDLDKEFVSKLTQYNLNNENIDTETRGTLADSTIKYAPDDDTRVYYGKEFSQNTKNPDVLEYIGAASKYVEDPSKRSQYNSYVTEAAKNYPPETQAKIQRAIETGKVSTATESASSKPAATTQQSKTPVTTPKVPTVAQTQKTTGSTTQPAVTTPTLTPAPTKATEPKPVTTADRNIDSNQTTEALQQKKDIVLDKIEDLQEHIAVEQAAREITDEAIEEFANAIEEIESTEDPTKINETKIKNFLNTNSLSVIYSKLIEKFGNSVIRHLISAVASYGNSSKIDTLASIIKDGSLLEELFVKCQNKRLLDKLQSSTVKKFIPMMSDLSVVRSDIMYEFIMDLINSNASIDEIKKYLHYLPFGMQANICETYNNLKGIQLDSNFALKPNRKNKQETTQETEDKTKVQTPKKEEKEEPKNQPALKPNELTAMKNDGVQIKRKETFAGISDQYEEDAYEVVDDKTGKTQSQREAILTPGSFEWNIKYNKQAPATAFTMAALDEENEDGIGVFGSNKVGMKQPIKKKYKPQDFRFNA